MSAKGISIHIGLNRVDSNHYRDLNNRPWPGTLVACENDARAMQVLAQTQGFTDSTVLLSEQATALNVIGAVDKAAQELHSGDLLFLTYSGHGGQVPDKNSEYGEDDDKDETWCLYDRQLVDDELYSLWGRFRPGVRIFVLSDSCHSGTVAKDLSMLEALSAFGDAAIKLLPEDVQEATYKANLAAYDNIQFQNPLGDAVDVKASVILLSGCQDSQFSLDGKGNSLFTAAVLKVWRDGKFKGNIKTFHQRIVEQMPPFQVPNLFKVGSRTSQFERNRPWQIAAHTSPPSVEPATTGRINPSPTELPTGQPASQGGQEAEPPPEAKLYVDPETLATLPPDLRKAWIQYTKNGFENNQLMFKRTLDAFMRPYHLTIGMYIIIFLVGILFFSVAVYLGLTGRQPATAIGFGSLSVISFVMFFIRQPVQALEENLEFISWLGVAFNTYWTRLMYISDKATVQRDLKSAADDYSKMVEHLIDKHASLRGKRSGSKLETTENQNTGA